MRFIVALPSVALAALLFSGCGESGDLQEGTPENVDFTKPVTPQAAVPVMDPDAAAKAKAAGAGAGPGTAPVMTPPPIPK